MVTNFLPKPSEIIERSIMFNEALRGYGFKCKVLIPTTNIPQIGYYLDIGYDESNTIEAYTSFDSHPKPKLLTKLGWNIENSSELPLICYLSRYVQPLDRPRTVLSKDYKEICPTNYTRISLDYSYEDLGREFIVTKVSSDEFNPIYFILSIVPYRPNTPINIDPLRDNNMSRVNIQETTDEFRFVGVNANNRSDDVDVKY